MKHEWRKHEKGLYIPKTKPELIDIPALKFFSIKGQGNPNSDDFAEHIGVLYAVSYGVRMSHKSNNVPDGYFEYTVYPLEGIWDITDEAKEKYDGKLNKDDLVYNIMIRQPEFVTEEYALDMIQKTNVKKPHPLLEKVIFETITEGRCIQMLHLGSFDNEKETFDIMEKYCHDNNLKRVGKIHREIYLSDARKTAPEKLKTVLRFNVE